MNQYRVRVRESGWPQVPRVAYLNGWCQPVVRELQTPNGQLEIGVAVREQGLGITVSGVDLELTVRLDNGNGWLFQCMRRVAQVECSAIRVKCRRSASKN